MTTHVQQTLPFPWQGGRQCSLQLLIQPWIYASGVPCTAGWTEAVWNTKFARHFYTWPVDLLGIEPQTF